MHHHTDAGRFMRRPFLQFAAPEVSACSIAILETQLESRSSTPPAVRSMCILALLQYSALFAVGTLPRG